GRSRLRAGDPQDPHRVRRRRRHRGALQPRDGAGRGPVQPRGDHRARRAAGRRHARSGAAGRLPGADLHRPRRRRRRRRGEPGMAGVLSSEHVRTASAQGVHHGEISAKALLRMQLRLKWTLWKRSYRKNVGKLIGTIIGALYGLGGLVSLVFLFLGTTLWAGEGETFPLVVRGLGALTVLAWFLIPVLAFGLDDTLDPRAFALFPRSAKELQPGLFAAAALSFPSLLTLAAVAIAT